MEKLKVIVDHVSQLKNNREMYLGNPENQLEYLSSLIADDARLLNVSEPQVLSIKDWYVVHSVEDWIKKNCKQLDSWGDVFQKVIPFPEAGLNCIRHEIFLMAFVSNIFIIKDRALLLIKGNYPPDDVIEIIESEGMDVGFAVGFSGPC